MSLVQSVNAVADSLVAFANDFTERFDTGLMGIITWAFAKLIKVYILAQIDFFIFAVGFSWATAKVLIQDMGIFPALNSALSSLSPQIAGFLGLMGFSDALNIIITALVARFVIGFIPGYKK